MGRFLHLAKRCTESNHKLYDATSAATLTLTGTLPTVAFRCRVTLSSAVGHTDCVGSVTVGSETATAFLAAGSKLTTTNLTALPVITTTNLDCHILIEAIDSGGQPIRGTVETDLPCKIEIKSKSIPRPEGGWTSIQATQMQARGTFATNDLIKFDINHPSDPTNGTTHPVVSWRPKFANMGKEDIKILEF